MSMNERDLVSMTCDARGEDHTRYVEALEKELEALSTLLERLMEDDDDGY